MADVISRVLLLILIMAAFLIIYHVWNKLNGVDLKKMQDKVDAIHTVVLTPTEDKDAEERAQRERCLICCDGCEKKETCAGNNGCDVCKKFKE